MAAAEARLAPLFEDGELDEDEVVAEQLDAGLFTLQVNSEGEGMIQICVAELAAAYVGP